MNQPERYHKMTQKSPSENDSKLKQRIEELERENRDLKRSVYLLSLKLNKLLHEVSSDSSRKLPFSASLDLTTVYPRDEAVLPRAESGSEAPRRKPTGRKTKQHRVLHWKFDLEGHAGAIYSADFSPCGQFVATGSLDKTVRLWDMENSGAREVACLEGHSLNVVGLSWSSDSRHLASASYDCSARMWDVSRQKQIHLHRVDGFVLTTAIDPGNSQLVYLGTTKNKIYIFDERDHLIKHVVFSKTIRSSIRSMSTVMDQRSFPGTIMEI
eukprot:271296_1